jgi:diguanylate cyclase (GGDEF)-like protein
VTFGLAAAASVAYIVAIAPPGSGGLPPTTVAIVGINITALILLAYVAMVIAREQRRARDAAIRLSTIDNLTGLFNRTFFFAAVEREIARSARSGRGFCLLMMDLDELKQINDLNGHFFGDRVLRGVGEVIRSGGRRIDTAARYGGDEFVVLLPETDPTGAYVLAEKIRLGVADLRVEVAGSMINPSISIGVVSYPEDGRTSDELMITADNSMYHSKRAGKNRVTGVPVMDQTVVGVPAAEAHVEAPPVAKRKPRAAPAEPAEAAREPADNSV